MIRRGLTLALVGLLACDASSYYLYLADIYDPSRDCVSGVTAVDIGTGPDPGTACPAKCLVGQDGDGGTIIYTTTMCGPVPYGVDPSSSDPRCTPALAALARSDTCLEGGTSTNPIPDAGADTLQPDAGAD